jgi:ubiquinone/menaquinone biosynthesis C-methylase UbiE
MSENAKRDYFNGLAPRWDGIPRKEDATAKLRRFVRQSADRAPSAVLDVGCGTGVLLADILDAFPQVDCVVEADFALAMLQENGRKNRDQRVHRVCSDAMRLPVPSGTFDLVLCFGILPHLEDGRAALAELLRVVKPGGSLAVGHLAGSSELNAFHGSLDGPVSRDVLPDSESLARELAGAGAVRVSAEEDPGWYFVRAEKPAG